MRRGNHRGGAQMTWRRSAFVLLLVLAGSNRAAACNVPVFRYALERWQPDPYTVLVFHEGGLAQADKKLVDGLFEYFEKKDCPTNFTIALVNVTMPLSPANDTIQKSTYKPHLP